MWTAEHGRVGVTFLSKGIYFLGPCPFYFQSMFFSFGHCARTGYFISFKYSQCVLLYFSTELNFWTKHFQQIFIQKMILVLNIIDSAMPIKSVQYVGMKTSLDSFRLIYTIFEYGFFWLRYLSDSIYRMNEMRINRRVPKMK